MNYVRVTVKPNGLTIQYKERSRREISSPRGLLVQLMKYWWATDLIPRGKYIKRRRRCHGLTTLGSHE